MEQVNFFPFMDLPQLVQEMIADEIIQNLDFKDQKRFILTSKYCNWLIQRSKMKKRIGIRRIRLIREKFVCESFGNDVLKFSTEEETVKFLKMVKIMKIDAGAIFRFVSIRKFGLVSPIKNLWLDAMEFLEEFYFIVNDEYFDLNFKTVSKLKHLKYCWIINYSPSKALLKVVDAIPKLSKLTFNGEMDDELLKLLASKSRKSNPLKKLMLVPCNGFSIDAVEHFFKRATFADDSDIHLEMNATLPEVEKMMKRIDKYEAILLKQEGQLVKMMLKKINEEICITVKILLKL
uniref:F-box domain-containing protein n=1 Tax=Panagrolaimus sp. JU765 TaxID=591449 RepID=A0AC34QMH2_9BILA